MDDFGFLQEPSFVAAPRLLGCWLVRELDGQQLIGRIVEVEAYSQEDAASHSFRGKTPRTEVMFGPSGHLYVYFTYGMHYCANVVTGPIGYGAGVLIRAVEPVEGAAAMSVRRHGISGKQLTNGPAKVCQALQIDKTWLGHDLKTPPLQLLVQPPLAPEKIVQTTRVGISHAQDVPWRFYEKDNPYVSRVATKIT
jgi:DNA-3-methyladenine glycosylase